jgi:hypothetical protein
MASNCQHDADKYGHVATNIDHAFAPCILMLHWQFTKAIMHYGHLLPY